MVQSDVEAGGTAQAQIERHLVNDQPIEADGRRQTGRQFGRALREPYGTFSVHLSLDPASNDRENPS